MILALTVWLARATGATWWVDTAPDGEPMPMVASRPMVPIAINVRTEVPIELLAFARFSIKILPRYLLS
jgi:hypothetical protein